MAPFDPIDTFLVSAIFPPAVKPAISTGGKQASLSGQGTNLTTATSRSTGQNIEDRIVIQPTICEFFCSFEPDFVTHRSR